MSPALRAIARHQAGVFSRDQALRAGATAHEIERLLLHGEWLEVESGVYMAASTPPTHRAICWAVTLAVGPPIAVARRSAAVELGLDRAPTVEIEECELVVPRPRRGDGTKSGARVRRVVASRFATVSVRGLPVTPPALTLRELGNVLPRDWVRDMTQHAIRRRLVTYSSLARELGRGLPGAATLRDVLTEVAPGYQVVWEGRLHAALRDAGVDLEPQVDVQLPGGRRAILDLGSRRLRLGVEVDGLVNHLDRFASDRNRDRLLLLAGWLIVHVAASEVADDLPRVVAHIVGVAEQRAAALNLVRQSGPSPRGVSA